MSVEHLLFGVSLYDRSSAIPEGSRVKTRSGKGAFRSFYCLYLSLVYSDLKERVIIDLTIICFST